MSLEIVNQMRYNQIGSLSKQDGDAEDNVDYEINLYFTYESRDTL